MAARRSVRYAVVDAFTGAPFKGNPGAVCFLEGEERAADEEWMQSVAMEFNLSETAFLIPDATAVGLETPRFHLRWFTPVDEVNLCGHATIAAAHFLLTSGIVKCDKMEFITKSGLLKAMKIRVSKHCVTSKFSHNETEENFSIELDFPVIPVVECDSLEIPSIPASLKGVSMVNVQKTATDGDLLVELASGKDVSDMQPEYDELQKCAGRGIIITGPAPPGSGFDFFTRFFCPKLGINEDPVTGSIHCALAPYWSKKLGKRSLVAYQASPRGGRLELQWEEHAQRVRIKGEAVTVMMGNRNIEIHVERCPVQEKSVKSRAQACVQIRGKLLYFELS